MRLGSCSRIWLGAITVTITYLLVAIPAKAAESRPQPFDNLERRDTAERTYEANAFGLIHREVTAGGLIFSRTYEFWRVVRGNYRLPVEYAEFFRAVGRPELADSYETRLTVSNVLGWTGLAAMLGGAGVGFWGFSKEKENVVFAGFGIAAAGGLLWVLGGAAPGPGITETEAARLVDRYNSGLTHYLDPSGRASLPPRSGWTVNPFAGVKAIGLACDHRF
jgi:hypothetical protein